MRRRYRTDEELEGYARRLRRATGFEFVPRLDLEEFLFKAASIFPGLTIETVDAPNLGADYAYFDAGTKTIVIRHDVSSSALAGNHRAIMTVLHEFAHAALAHPGTRFRAQGADLRSKNIPETRFIESEAKRLAGMLAAPGYLIDGYKIAPEIVEAFNISPQAALVRLEQWETIRRKSTKTRRRTLPFVRAFLEELQSKNPGYTVTSLENKGDSSPHLKGLDIIEPHTTYEIAPCLDCGNKTVLRRGSDITCETCGRPCGCG